MEWAILEKIQTGRVEDILFWKPPPLGNFRFVTLPQEIPEKKSFYPWKFCKFVWHSLKIPKSKTKKFHVLPLSPLPYPVWIFSRIAQSPLLLCKLHHFADDTNLLLLTNSIEKLNKLINIDLKNLSNWLNSNKTSLNVEKTETIIFKSRRKKYEGVNTMKDLIDKNFTLLIMLNILVSE